MSTPRRTTRNLTVRRHEVHDPVAANKERADKLRHNALRRRARAFGLELRRSDYGYSLIDGERARVGDRNDMTLDEVAAHLDSTSR
jgi:hypothetical protein